MKTNISLKHFPDHLIVIAVALMVMISSWAFGQEKLNGMVAYSLKKIPTALEKAEKLADQGDLKNAKVYLESAQNNWDMINKDFKNKFDPDHPDIVAVRKQLKTVTAMLAKPPAGVEGTADPGKETPAEPAKRATPPTEIKKAEVPNKEAPAKPVKAKVPAITDPLPSTMIYEMKQFGPALDKAEEYVEAMELRTARSILGKAQHEWDTKKGWDKGKFNPKHPDVVALDARFAEVTKAVNALGAKADDAAENLPAALDAVAGSSKRLYETYDQARVAIRDLSSYRSDFDRGGEDDIGKLLTRMDEVRVLVERVNVILPDALSAAQAFRKQFPDFKALDKLVRDGTKVNGYKAGKQVKRLEAFPAEWLQEVNMVINGALEEADSNIEQYGTDNLDSLQGRDKALKSSAANAAEKWVLDYSSIMIETINTMLPELPSDAQSSLTEFVAARQAFLKRAADMEQSIERVAEAVSEVRDEVVKSDLRRLAGARFPKSKYTGGKWNDAKKDIRAAWAQKIKDKKLVKVAIYSPWEENKEARWVNDRWVVGKYRYIGANCLAKLSSGKYMVYRMMFRNTMQEDESWSPLEQWSVGHVYEILEENIGE